MSTNIIKNYWELKELNYYNEICQTVSWWWIWRQHCNDSGSSYDITNLNHITMHQFYQLPYGLWTSWIPDHHIIMLIITLLWDKLYDVNFRDICRIITDILCIIVQCLVKMKHKTPNEHNRSNKSTAAEHNYK